MRFIESLANAFLENGNPKNAVAMAKYMRNHFTFFVIKTDERRRISKPFGKNTQMRLTKMREQLHYNFSPNHNGNYSIAPLKY